MLIRHLRREDLLAANKVRSIAFHGDLEAMNRKTEQMTEEKLGYEWGCFDEAGVLMGCIRNNRFTAWLDGRRVSMGGIGGVATLPEYRYGGAIKEIFASLLREAREEGEVLSSLFPFSHEFYRKVGYEMCVPVYNYEFPVTALRGFRHNGWTRRMEPGESRDPLKAVYEAYAPRYNLMVDRKDDAYAIGDPFRDFCFTMLLGAEEGRAEAYLKYQLKKTDGRNVLDIADIAFTGLPGLRMVLGFLQRMSADYRAVRMPLPADIPLWTMLPEPYELKCTLGFSPMARITNVPAALAALKIPRDTAFSIQVQDDFLPENSGIWRVSGEGAERSTDEPDLAVSVQALALLALGTLDMSHALARNDVALSGNGDALQRAFPGKPVFIADHF